MTEIFVFGSNLAGKHGAGSARRAYERHGAIYGQGRGFQGQSYAIPTKDEQLKVLPIEDIAHYVNEFIRFAETHEDWRFKCVAIGCGLAGYRATDIGPLFRYVPSNVSLPPEFVKVITACERKESSDYRIRQKALKESSSKPRGTITRAPNGRKK